MASRTGFEYRTTYSIIPGDFPNYDRGVAEDLSKISPKPPKGEDWQLASTVTAVTERGIVVFYYWERPVSYIDMTN